MNISDVETPAILIDLDVMERNLRRVNDYARQHGLRLRPHTKTHKIPALGQHQVELGAVGLTVAKVGEAEVMLRSQTPDLLVAYPVIGASKLDRLMQVAKQTRITVALDNDLAATQLSEAAVRAGVEVGVLAETDVGMGRVGVTPGEELVAFAKRLAALPKLSLLGVAFYPGQIKMTDELGFAAVRKLSQLVESIVADFRKAGLPIDIVSGGSTPMLFHSHEVAGLNEIRPGTYIFNDRNEVALQACEWQDCAASIMVTVISRARPRQMIIDGGSKTFSSDGLATGADKLYGRVLESDGAEFFKMNEEHGYVDLANAARTDFQVGERVRVIPNHICVCMNLHEQVYGIRGDKIEHVWKVEGRGKLQ